MIKNIPLAAIAALALSLATAGAAGATGVAGAAGAAGATGVAGAAGAAGAAGVNAKTEKDKSDKITYANMKEKILKRFLEYVGYDTQSAEDSDTYPSTAKQLVLLERLRDELKEIGAAEVEMSSYGYVTGTIPASKGYENAPVIGFLAHVDTSFEMTGANVKPRVIENYDGGDIKLNDKITMAAADFPKLARLKGHTLITTDGTTLLGADDKAGVAEIMTAAEYLLNHPEVKHGKIRIAFTPDEEVGNGTAHFDVKAFGARFAYTIDGGEEGEIEFENFNAATAKISIQGLNIHPGAAKDKMKNALRIANRIENLIPEGSRPENTQGYEGFFHLWKLSGTPEYATMEYIIRDHSMEMFKAKKDTMKEIERTLNKEYGEGTVTIDIRDEYYNMKEMIEPFPQLVEIAKTAMKMAGVVPIQKPVRGGTDGSRLSYMGLPCPNVFTGGGNYHGRYEYASLDSMGKAVETIVNMAVLWGKQK